VDFHDGIFSAPVAGKRNLLKIRRLNENYLSITHDNVGLLLKCQKAPGKMRNTLKKNSDRIVSLREKRPDDPEAPVIEILADLLAEAKQRNVSICNVAGTSPAMKMERRCPPCVIPDHLA
jgi:hypothetical protein